MRIQISKLGPESAPLLRNLFEHYMHDMAEWFQFDTTADGSYSYDTSQFWTQGFEIHLAKAGDSIVGFAVVGSAVEWLRSAGAHDVHEFFIMRRFRRSGAGRQLAEHIWNQHPGEWLVRVFEGNRPAVPFWRAAIKAVAGGSCAEAVHIIKGRNWRFFRFRCVVRSAE